MREYIIVSKRYGMVLNLFRKGTDHYFLLLRRPDRNWNTTLKATILEGDYLLFMTSVTLKMLTLKILRDGFFFDLLYSWEIGFRDQVGYQVFISE